MHLETLDYYNANSESLAAKYKQADVKEIQALLSRWLPAQGRVLEIGCGCGRDAAYAAALGCQVLATDASPAMLAQAVKAIAATGLSSKVTLKQQSFPCQQGDQFLNQKFDAVLASAVIMHLPDHELFEFAFQIKTLLKANGLFICSFCTERPQDPDDTRLFSLRQPAEVQLMFERLGFKVLASEISKDTLGRPIKWATLVFSLENSIGTRPVDQIESIINRDKKVATYKLALLKALCEIAQTSSQHARFLPGDIVSLPLGLLVEKWLYYYWPLIDTELNLPEMQVGVRARGLSFRGDLRRLIDACGRGGLDSFYSLFESGRLNSAQTALLKKAATSIASTIVSGPIQYAGGAAKDVPRIFLHKGSLRLPKCETPTDLLGALGHIYIPATLWREMCLLGHWIGEAITMRWAELSHEFTKKEVPVQDILSRLIIRPEADRMVTQARQIYCGKELECVWTGKTLKPGQAHIDHVIPFTLWHNNDLWNLLPADPHVNNQKRDKIVTRHTLYASKDRIVGFWRIAKQEAPLRFQAELSRTLLRGPQENNWEIPAFSALSEAIETVALQRGVQRWEN
ncbi:MAG: hypothetical protein A2117_01405 [Candidatus Wildermuthbacteria bacterium GWA2_46_15]|uniref:HNH nuclease domain-containing protein n=1 Tax=Candidatus Wildermuthbacteria bacterium GWA2_46_15 TaxID=1802443 RepID=A0A1G2QQI1_9BACT|nr:MAG: hypothetical protein A2117_01405 [Candidatus Wildermuthbacteria bacterium GWA2_46_15]